MHNQNEKAHHSQHAQHQLYQYSIIFSYCHKEYRFQYWEGIIILALILM